MAQAPDVNFSLDSKEFRKVIRKFSENVQKMVWKEGITSALATLDGLVKENIVKQNLIDRGRLLNSWNLEVLPPEGNQYYGLISTNVVYARIHEYGGIIKPRTAKMLAWKGKDGKMHFAKSVTIKARPYFRSAFDEGGDLINKNFAKTIKSILNHWGAL